MVINFLEESLTLNKPKLEILKNALIKQGLLTMEEQSILLNINIALEKIERTEELLSKPVLFEVIYIGEGILSYNLTKDKAYPVIEELEDKYVIINDSFIKSTLKKKKFQKAIINNKEI